jgi:hypothetical protein
VFDKAYDIPNATVAAKLADGGVGWGVRSDRSRREVAESTLSGKDKSVD